MRKLAPDGEILYKDAKTQTLSSPTSILKANIRKPPDIAEANCESERGQEELTMIIPIFSFRHLGQISRGCQTSQIQRTLLSGRSTSPGENCNFNVCYTKWEWISEVTWHRHWWIANITPDAGAGVKFKTATDVNLYLLSTKYLSSSPSPKIGRCIF